IKKIKTDHLPNDQWNKDCLDRRILETDPPKFSCSTYLLDGTCFYDEYSLF
ncbi:hypothetical protein J6590_094669, partial [Homalodisca vitripennis]